MARRIETDYDETATLPTPTGLLESAAKKLITTTVTERVKRDFEKIKGHPLHVLYAALGLLVLAFVTKLLAFVLVLLFWPLLILAVALAITSGIYAIVKFG